MREVPALGVQHVPQLMLLVFSGLRLLLAKVEFDQNALKCKLALLSHDLLPVA